MPQPYVPNPPVTTDDAEYLAAARAEAEFWSRPQIYSIDGWVSAADGPIKRHYNRRFTGDEHTPWFETIARHGPYRRGLVLGCGGMLQEARILETNPGVHLTFCDIDESGLAKRAEEFGARFPGRVATRQIDLNFADLEPATFDLIVSGSTLHHIVNLEHVAGQIAKTLSDDGWFFLYDYTGESGMRFRQEQKRVFELIYERERARNPSVPSITWHDAEDGTYSPFEAIRGGETVGILREHLHEVERRTAGAIVGLLFFTGLLDNGFEPRRPAIVDRLKRRFANQGSAVRLLWEDMLSAECLRELSLMDAVVCDAKLFLPNNSFVTYRKRR